LAQLVGPTVFLFIFIGITTASKRVVVADPVTTIWHTTLLKTELMKL
jgi:hypothetical protein